MIVPFTPMLTGRLAVVRVISMNFVACPHGLFPVLEVEVLAVVLDMVAEKEQLVVVDVALVVVELEMVADEDEVVVDVELDAEVLDAAALTASANVPIPGSLLPSPEYAAVIVSGDAEGEGV